MSLDNPSGNQVWTPPEEKPLAVEQAKPVTPLPLSTTHQGRTWADVAYYLLGMVAALCGVGWKFVKLGICIALDLADLAMVGWIGVGEIWEVIAALITVALWGRKGWWALLELLDPTELLDPFVPSCTIIALAAWNDK